ncbi:uncharacterized protein LOC114579886, partial [Dendrobium catenatum]|uniref:uncharacterized protein LOC114579886 n=1 Tax=Dendrobium catenatum TaxID=906689 RepID=UPI0010A0513A
MMLRKMDNNKSLGADGANACFFKNYWNIIEEATWNAIDEFFKSGMMPEQWKETMVVLILKVQNAKECSKFRPICLCQMVYKLAASMILNIIKSCLPKVISQYQGAFVSGRSISDNCLIAREITRKMKSLVVKLGFFLLRLDMEQAYDSMCWETLNQVLMLAGFPEKLIQLIMQCVSNPKYSIMINGKRTNWINARCGFRQGCPMSPNDVLVVAKAYSKNVRTLKHFLTKYCGRTGQEYVKGTNVDTQLAIIEGERNEMVLEDGEFVFMGHYFPPKCFKELVMKATDNLEYD